MMPQALAAMIFRAYAAWIIANALFEFGIGVAYQFEYESGLSALSYGGQYYSENQLALQGLWELCVPIGIGSLLWVRSTRLAMLVQRAKPEQSRPQIAKP